MKKGKCKSARSGRRFTFGLFLRWIWQRSRGAALAEPRRRIAAGRLWRGLAGGYWPDGFGGALPADIGRPGGRVRFAHPHSRASPYAGRRNPGCFCASTTPPGFRLPAHCSLPTWTLYHPPFHYARQKTGGGGSGGQKEFWEIKAAPFPGVIRRERRWSGFCICQFYYLTRILLISYSSSGICLVIARASWMSKSTKAPPL